MTMVLVLTADTADATELFATPSYSLVLQAGVEYRIQGTVGTSGEPELAPTVRFGAIDVATPAAGDFDVSYTPSVDSALYFGGTRTGAIGYAGWYFYYDDLKLWKTSDEASDELLYWTEGGGAVLTKETGAPYEGEQNLRVSTDGDEYSRQSVEVDAIISEGWVNNAWRLHDSGAGTIYELRQTGTIENLVNAESLTNPAGLTAASNATDATALEFDGVSDGAGGECRELIANGAITAWVKVNDASRADTFRLKPTASGYKALPADITIDGVTVSPAIRLEGENADLTSWDDTLNGNSFAIAGTGDDPEFDELDPGIDCKRVKFNGDGSTGVYFEAPSTSIGQVSTDDIVSEIVFKVQLGAVYTFASKYADSGDQIQWLVTAAGALRLYVNSNFVAAGTVSSDVWYHAIAFVDRSGQAKTFVNGTGATPVTVSGDSGADLGETAKWTIGSSSAITGELNGSVSYFALWHRASWLSTADQAAVAAERFARCCGVYAETAQDVNRLIDGDMEAAGVADWTASNCTLTKEMTGPYEGSQVIRALRTGSAGRFYQSGLIEAGKRYRIIGQARGDGTNYPALYYPGLPLFWTGTTSTDWQEIDVTLTAPVNDISFYSGLNVGNYTEYDDIKIFQDGAVPQTQSRTTQAYLEKWNIAETEAYLIPVGANWIRTDKVKDDAGTLKTGIRGEFSGTNLLLQSEDFSNASWTKTRVATGTAIEALGDQNFDAIIASADNATHYVQQAVTVTADAQSLSVYAKAGDVDGLKIAINEDATQYAYFDLTNGTVGTTGAGLDADNPARIEPKGDGVYRCEIRYVSGGTTATVRFYATDGETDSWTGDAATVSLYLFGAQLEDNADLLSSYVKTTTATATRTAESLYYYAYENAGGSPPDKLTMIVEIFAPLKTTCSNNNAVCGLDDGSVANRISFSLLSALNSARLFVVSGGGSVASIVSGGVDTTSFKLFQFDASVDYFAAYEARNELGSDTAGAMPVSLTLIKPIQNLDANALNKVVSDFAISPYGLSRPRGIIFANDGAGPGPFIAYDDLDGDGTTCELRASADQSGEVVLNGGTLVPGTWYHVALVWTAAGSTLYLDGSVIATGAAGDVSDVDQMHLGWAGLLGYDETDTATEYATTYGDASVAGLQVWLGEHPDADELAAIIADGLPPYEAGLVHEYGGRLNDGASSNYRDYVSGSDLLASVPASAATDQAYSEAGVGISSLPTIGLDQLSSGASLTALGSTDFAFSGYVRIDGNTDQMVWGNGAENSTTWHALIYDSATEKLTYYRVIGATLRSISATIQLSRLYHVVVSCDYDGSNSTLLMALDGAFAASSVYAGAPNVTEDELYLFESGGSPAMQMSGTIVAPRFYDVAKDMTAIAALSARFEAIIENFPYATQSITPSEDDVNLTGFAKTGDGFGFVMVQEEPGGVWRAANIIDASFAGSWASFEVDRPVNDIRLAAKGINLQTDYFADFDLISGGDGSGGTSIELVEVDANKRRALEELILARKPLHAWAVMVVRYV